LPNFFQLKAAGDASATISQLIFSGSYIVGLQAAKAYSELSKKSSKQTKIEIVENVTKAYYMVMIGQERMSLFNINLSRLDTLLRQTRALNENGFVEKIDVDRLEVSYNNLLIEKQKGENLLELGRVLLKYQIGMPVDKSLIVKEKISELPSNNIVVANRPDVKNRIEYNLLQTKRELEVLNLKNVRAGYLPTLAAFATGGIFNSHNKFERMFITPWYSYSLVGLNLSVPIFDGFGKYYKGQQAKLEIQKSDNDLRNLENTINLQVKQSEISLKNYQITLESQKRNLDLATEIARVTKIKYQEGIGSNLEVVTAESSLRESQVNYFNAMYDVLVANVDYQVSLGTLPVE
ncbi:MAG TPA: TolC family protein, partial [Cytophagaceae bacterium]